MDSLSSHLANLSVLGLTSSMAISITNTTFALETQRTQGMRRGKKQNFPLRLLRALCAFAVNFFYDKSRFFHNCKTRVTKKQNKEVLRSEIPLRGRFTMKGLKVFLTIALMSLFFIYGWTMAVRRRERKYSWKRTPGLLLAAQKTGMKAIRTRSALPLPRS